MGQFNYKERPAAQATPPEWLKVSAAVGKLVNEWAGRGDVVARVQPGTGSGHPACFNPRSSEVEVNIDVCFMPGTDPADVETIDDRATQFEWPRATGAIFHEACHARYSLWSLEEASRTLSPAEFTALVLLEEGRIERHGIKSYPNNAPFLRTMALNIVLSDLDNVLSTSDTVSAGTLCALALARVDSGSLEQDDVEAIESLVETKIGVERLANLQMIWRDAQSHDKHFTAEPMYELARRWVKIIDEAAEENGDSSSEEAESGRGSGSGSGEGDERSEFMKEIERVLKESAEAAEIAAYGDICDVQTQEEWAEQLKNKANDRKIDKDSAETASEVFGRGTGVVDDAKTKSQLKEERAPLASERIAAVKIAQLLEKAKYRDRSETEISSAVPPGRLRTRAAVQGAALKSKGVLTRVEPWRRTVRKHTDDPMLNIGVMVDISGSMGSAMQPMASTAWILSEAIRRVQGRAAMVYYGQDVFSTLKPGQHLDRVAVYSAVDATEKFDRAFKALNGGLNLLGGSGARLLVVFSDGEYTSQESVAARRWVSACQAAGVGVLWINTEGTWSNSARRIIAGTSAKFLEVPSDPATVAIEIGRAAAAALTAVA